MLLKCATVCLVALALLGLCDAQGGFVPGVWAPESQQQKQIFEKPLTWKYPEDPKPKPKPDVPFQLRYPVSASSVAVDCREDIVHVEVKKDFFGVGQLINSADLTLGSCAVVGEDIPAQVLIYQAQLQNCGSTLKMTGDSFIYTFTLNYNPQPVGDSAVIRTNKAAVVVECHYQRKHNVSSLALDPLWVPYSVAKMAQEFLYFTLTLMTEDWKNERPSNQYFLGDEINFEVSVMQYHHVPLRVYVDKCVATVSADATSSPRYAFIEQGCMIDGRLTGSISRFLDRTAENKLQFQLESFKFQNDNVGKLYITCHLRATSVAQVIDSNHRACSYIRGWKEAAGYDGACGSCESLTGGQTGIGIISGTTGGGHGNIGTGSTGTGTTGTGTGNIGGGTPVNPIKQVSWLRGTRDVSQQEVLEWEGEVTLGPISIEEKNIA
ncbi:zona pellucida sperm-binding protein 3-like [Neolamprologus brichardi]|uniref:Zona pellucida sperm-binding protein 3 n=1 Tax=Neolamprologus brichardi TaxID=32507 RepID=A0A3Q4GFV1_NEOBR|nr:zona pellucida sperm-binding protein 3-like [Neolamprologus brichardi]